MFIAKVLWNQVNIIYIWRAEKTQLAVYYSLALALALRILDET